VTGAGLLKATRPTCAIVVTHSLQTHLALQSVRRRLGETWALVRPITARGARSCGAVLVTTGRSKTNVFNAKLRTVGIVASNDLSVCLAGSDPTAGILPCAGFESRRLARSHSPKDGLVQELVSVHGALIPARVGKAF
jgi:hypothetical protein